MKRGHVTLTVYSVVYGSIVLCRVGYVALWETGWKSHLVEKINAVWWNSQNSKQRAFGRYPKGKTYSRCQKGIHLCDASHLVIVRRRRKCTSYAKRGKPRNDARLKKLELVLCAGKSRPCWKRRKFCLMSREQVGLAPLLVSLQSFFFLCVGRKVVWHIIKLKIHRFRCRKKKILYP